MEETAIMEKIYSASPMQQGMYFHDMISEQALYYNQVSFGIEGTLDIENFKRSVQLLIDTHEVLRSRYFLSGEKNVSVGIAEQGQRKAEVEVKDITSLSEEEKDKFVEDEIRAGSRRKVDLEKGELMHMALYRYSDNYHVLVWGCHHIALDGWCMSILINELFGYYSASLKGNFSIREEVPYSSYLEWLKESDDKESADYWKDYLKDKPERVVLPTWKKTGSYSLDREFVRLNISKEKMDKVKNIAAGYHVTVSTIIQGIWGLLVCKYGNTKEAIWGCVTSGRSVPVDDADSIVGLFINTLPVIFRLDKDNIFLEQLSKLGMDIFQAEFKSRVSLNDISDRPQELFDHIFAFENLEFADMLSGAKFDTLMIKNAKFYDRTNYDLTIKAQPSDELYIEWHYNPEVYDRSGIEQIAKSYSILLDQLINNPEKKVKDFKLLTEDEELKLIAEINKKYDKTVSINTVQEQFVKIASEYKDSVAIRENGNDLYYSELLNRSYNVALILKNNGAEHGDVIGIDAVNGTDTVSCMLGILMAGCTYLPLDIKLPEKRREYFIEKTGMSIVISDKPEMYKDGLTIISKNDAIGYNVGSSKDELLNEKYLPGDIAYIMFTSGSTGEPKGVCISSGSLYSFAAISKNSLQYGLPGDRVAQVAVLSFDASIYEIFSTLLTGGTVVIASPEDKENAVNLTKFFSEEKITRAFITTQLFNLMVDEDVKCFEGARIISAGGERASARHFRKAADENPDVKIINTYGPTECVCFASGYLVKPFGEEAEEIPIGFPEANHIFYVMDGDGNLCPPYAEGELYIGGDNASGYFGREDLTNEAFIEDPFSEGRKIYKSGDMVRYIPGEGMIFLNRKDTQVKIRGFRIEASEIENALNSCNNVKQSFVRIVKKNEIWKIYGYYTSNQAVEAEDVKNELSKYLPSYMMPNALLQMKEFPMNKNGKIDKNSFPDIENDTETVFVLPQNDVQNKLLSIWQEVLGDKEIGIRHNFFEHGGDSIKAMQIIGLMKKYGLNAEIRTLFHNPTIEKFSEYVYQGESQSQEALEGECPLLPIQKEFFKENYADKDHFNQSALVKIKASVTKEQLEHVMDGLIAHHDMLRAKYIYSGDKVTQYIQPVGAKSYMIHEFESYDKDFTDDEMDKEIENIQKMMDIEKGILIQLGLFKEKEAAYLFIAVHHLVMDGVSFRLILRDIRDLFKGELNNEKTILTPKTVSYRDYAKAQEEAEIKELPWDETCCTNLDRLSGISSPERQLKLKDRKSVSFILSGDEKIGLNKYLRLARGVEYADALLAIISKSISDTFGIKKFAVDIEHNGRGFGNQSFDLSNTVGWFTAIYPYIFNDDNDDLEKLIKNTSDIQKKYRKYSSEYMIRKISGGTDKENEITRPEICFNYLGDFDNLGEKSEEFEIVKKTTTGNRSEDQRTDYHLEINSLSFGDSLRIMIDYDDKILDENSINSFISKIRNYISHLGAVSEDKFYEPFPLSSLQMAYFIGKQDFYELGGFTTHNYIEMETKVDIERLNNALQKLIINQEMLRTVVVKDGTQRVLREIPEYKIELEDLRGLSKEEQERQIKAKRNELSHYVFDIYHFPLFDIGGFILTDEDKYLFIGYDTIMLDSGSANLLIRDLAYYYLHPDETPVPLDYHYRDYIYDWENLKTGELYEEAKEYWTSKLETFPEAPRLPMICDPEQVTKGHFLRKVKRYSVDEYNILKRKSASHRMTISALLLSVYAHTMNFYSGMDRFALNLTIFNRPTFNKDIERLYGDFTSTILLDFDLSEGKNFWEESEKVQATLGKALEYRIYDGINFSRDVMRKFRYPKTKAMMPMVFTSLLFENDIWEDVKNLGDVKWQIGQTPQVYVDFNVLEQGGELVIQMDYVSELFDEDMIEKVFSAYCHMLDDVAGNKDEIWQPCLSEEEESKRAAYNDTNEEVRDETTLIKLFDTASASHEEKTALIYGKEKISYKELNRLSDRIAYDLIKNGNSHEPVGIMIERTPGTIINILGILKAGGCYVPILPDFPKERVRYIEETSKLKIILTADKYKDLPDADKDIDLMSYRPEPEDSAYILFTSGSTGTPKGVEILHKAATNTIQGANQVYGVDENDVIIGMSEMSFDMSVYDIFGSLGAGGTLVMVPDVHAIEDVAMMVEEHKVSVWQTVPALMQMYMSIRKAGQGSSIRHVMLGGDFIPKQLAKDILEKLPNARFMSIGGPTETAIMDIYYEVKEVKDEWKSIPYGYPIRNSQIYIMDSKGRECPDEVMGEICAGGMGIAKGYVGMPELTKERFIDHEKYGRIFRTGDYGIYKKDGYVEICGRKDGQVKIQGMRIELGEIENVLLKHPGVTQAAALIHEDKNGSRQIVCFVEADNEEYPAKEFIDFAAEYLTDYMRPSIVRVLDKLPLSGNNKIDRRKLMESLAEIQSEKREIVLPENEIEEKLLEIWKEVLCVDEAGVTDDFFECGGDSLKAMELLSKIKKELDWSGLLLTDILKSGTIRGLAEFKLSGSKGSILRELSEISPNKKKAFFIHGGNGSADSYKKIVAVVKDRLNCYGIDLMKAVTLEPKKISLRELAEEYAEAITSVTVPEDEVTLVGWCIGGTICFEAAYILEKAGYTKIKLMFLDTQDPGRDVIYDYTVDTELEFIKSLSFDKYPEGLDDINDISEFWEKVVKAIEDDKELEKEVKKSFMTMTAGILMNPEQLSVRETIMLNNFFRSTVDNAHNVSVSGKLHHTKAIYIKAAENSVSEDPNKWQEYFDEELPVITLEGTHFSIMEDYIEKYTDWLG